MGSIVSACAGLVTVNREGDIVRLTHPTAQEYFSQRLDEWFPDAHAHMASACVGYLSFGVFGSGYCKSEMEFEKRLKDWPLYRYAAHNWGYHVEHALKSNPLDNSVLKFCQ